MHNLYNQVLVFLELYPTLTIEIGGMDAARWIGATWMYPVSMSSD